MFKNVLNVPHGRLRIKSMWNWSRSWNENPGNQILADESISSKAVRFLRNAGFNVLDVKEEQWHGRDDGFLMDIARRDCRFILIHDSDFAQ